LASDLAHFAELVTAEEDEEAGMAPVAESEATVDALFGHQVGLACGLSSMLLRL
jgi:hypothetical protein